MKNNTHKFIAISLLCGCTVVNASQTGGTIVIQNESQAVTLYNCRASNLIPYTALEQKGKNKKVTEKVFYFSELFDSQTYNKGDHFAKPWMTSYRLQLKLCGIDHRQSCDDNNFLTNPANLFYLPRVYLGGGYNKLFTPTRPGAKEMAFNSEYFIDVTTIPVYYKGIQYKDNDEEILKKVDEELVKRHNLKKDPIGYDKFLGAISKNGIYSQSYDHLWSQSSINNVYSNVECDIVNKITRTKIGIVGATINAYGKEDNGDALPTTTPFLSGSVAKNKLSVKIVNQISGGHYNYTKLQLIDRVSKTRRTDK